jgi:basic membrane protein A
MSLNVERVLTSIQNGTFKGGNMLLKADSDSTGYVKASNRNQLASSTIEKLESAYNEVKSGNIVPPSNFGGFTPDEFTVN